VERQLPRSRLLVHPSFSVWIETESEEELQRLFDTLAEEAPS